MMPRLVHQNITQPLLTQPLSLRGHFQLVHRALWRHLQQCFLSAEQR